MKCTLHSCILPGSPEENVDPIASVVEVDIVGGAIVIVDSFFVTSLPSLMLVLEVDTFG